MDKADDGTDIITQIIYVLNVALQAREMLLI